MLLKATGGGGGMGIHKCATVADVRTAFPLAVSQGTKSFGNGHLFVEKYIERAKHIEVQVCTRLASLFMSLCYSFTPGLDAPLAGPAER